MKKTILLVWLVLLSAFTNAQQVVTTANLNMRTAPTTESQVLYHVPQGTTIDLNGCQEDWCEVSISGHSGFIARKYTASLREYQSVLHKQGGHAIGSVNYYTNSRGNVVQSPTRYDAQPAGATAQCRDGSYSFSQSRRGTCSHHGGVARWLQ